MTRAIRSEYLILLFSVLMMLGYNQGLWLGIIDANPQFSIHTFLFFASCAVFMTALFNLLFNLIALKKLVKPALILIVMSSAVASFFIDRYGVHIDSSMLQNVFETDTAEATELFSMDFLLHIAIWGLLPGILIGKLKVIYSPWTRQLVVNVFSILMSILAMGLVAAFFYQDYASTFRNHRDLRYLINPTSYIYATVKVIGQHIEREKQPLVPISQLAALGDIAKSKQRRSVTVMVVGETARAEQFHLDGYSRQTTPELENRALINFDQVSSCGTTTAVSLPCMFSKFTKDDYSDSRGHGYESVLDVIAKAGTEVVWIDNNSGCKGVCDRVTSRKVDHLNLADVCTADDCYDEVLLWQLQNEVDSHSGDLMIVLHQKGSHGPAYDKRVPDSFRKYTPVCETSELQQCSQQEITNAYDNTILYTDFVLSQIVDYLQQLAEQSDTDTAMLYVSDHGESLGEHNLYLHGAPSFIAPSQQTHVPMLMWLSANYEQDYQLDESCLQAKRHDPLSHDNLFHTLLGMTNVTLPETYDAKQDLFASCRLKNAI